MNVSFDIFNHKRTSSLILCNPNGQELYSLAVAKERQLSMALNELSELSFEIPRFVDSKTITPYYTEVKTRRIIKLEDIGQFLITKVETVSEGVTEYKKVTCKGLEFELSSKNIDILEGTYALYNLANPSKSLLHIVLSYLPTWSIDTVDGELWDIWRTFDIKDNNIYNFLMGEVQEAFDCVFIFDTFKRKIKVVKTKNLPKKTDIFISNRNLMKELEIVEDADNIITALDIYGDGELSIRTVNPLGTPTIYDFSYYATNEWMTPELVVAVNKWQQKIKDSEQNYANLLQQAKEKQEEIDNLNNKIADLETEKRALEQKQGMAVVAKDDDSCSKYAQEIKVKDAEINTEKNKVKVAQTNLDKINISLQNITSSLSFENNFTDEQIKELSNFIYQSSLQNTNFAVTDLTTLDEQREMMYDLYNWGKEQLSKCSKPIWEFSVDVINFLNLIEYKSFSNQLELGNEITIEVDKENDLYASALLLGYSLDLDDFDTLELTFASELKFHSSTFTFEELFDSTSSISKSFNFESYSWQKGSQAYSMIDDYMHNALDLTTQDIKATDNQEFVISNVGIRGRELDTETNTYLNEQLWITKNVIAFSDDEFNTIKTALGKIYLPDGSSSYGLIADFIVGRMMCGKSLLIENENSSFKVDGSGVYIKNSNLMLSDTDGTVHSMKEILGITDQKITDTKTQVDKVFGTILADDGRLDTTKMTGQILAGKNNIYCVNTANNKALIMNENGLAISNKKGSNGQFIWSTAITGDGIVADVIQANSTLAGVHISGGDITIGTNKAFYVDNNGNVSISRGSINIGSGNFVVDSVGNVTIKKGNVAITNGSINLGSGNFIVNSSGVVTMKKGSINLGNGAFTVDTNGNVSANSLKLKLADKSLSGSIDFSNLTVKNLVVGNNVSMGANATISWNKVSSKPSDLAYLDDIPDDDYITEITESYIRTTSIYARYLEVDCANIRGTIEAEALYTDYGVYIEDREMGFGNGSAVIEYYSGTFKFYSSKDVSFEADDIWFEPYGAVRIDGDLRISGDLYINNVCLDSYDLNKLLKLLN